MSPLCEKRGDRWEGKGVPRPQRQHPLTFAERCDFPAVQWIFHNEAASVALAEQIKAFDRDVEIIFDKSTTTPGTAEPGHHCYRVTRRGGTPNDDSLKRLFSLTDEECALIGHGIGGTRIEWMHAKAKAPGDWVLVRLKELDKRNMIGDEAHIETACGDAVMANVEANEKAKDALFDAEDEEAAEIMLTGAKNSKHHKPRPKPGPPVHVSMRARSPILRGAFVDGKPVIMP